MMFGSLGAKVLDADRIAHRLMRSKTVCFRKIIKNFGKDILTSGRVDREKLARLVFQDPRQRRKLEKIIHPEVRKYFLTEIRKNRNRRTKKTLVLDVPLLFESKIDKDVDIVIVVKANREKQIARATKSLKVTKAEAKRRIKAQMPLRTKIRLADMIIDNNGTLNQTKKQVIQIWEKL